ncbi:hypothetical protein J2T10_001965 [Paenarthrobacter nicotinovorans]|uniref:Uncharacterized protein n=1 Tax=Paenarthrobacter nicotinovorans TaxID=29320 RepID=A0ABT9TKY8_PAENI|nr:hypothetical protein [Paenarthrobacter nicotinovorans]
MTDQPVTVNSVDELYALPAGFILRSSDERHQPDYWLTRGDLTGDCISAGDYSGPLCEVSLPAIVLQPQR